MKVSNFIEVELKITFCFLIKGQRICIGMRFGQVQTKLTLAFLLQNFNFSPCSRTDFPIQIDPITLIHGPKGEVWLKITKAE